MTVFVVVRQFSGSYHSKTVMNCLVLFKDLVISTIFIEKYIIPETLNSVCYYSTMAF